MKTTLLLMLAFILSISISVPPAQAAVVYENINNDFPILKKQSHTQNKRKKKRLRKKFKQHKIAFLKKNNTHPEAMPYIMVSILLFLISITLLIVTLAVFGLPTIFTVSPLFAILILFSVLFFVLFIIFLINGFRLYRLKS